MKRQWFARFPFLSPQIFHAPSNPTLVMASSRQNVHVSNFMSRRTLTATRKRRRRRRQGPSAAEPTVIHYGEHCVKSAVLDSSTLRRVLTTAEQGDFETACWIANAPPSLVASLLGQAEIDYDYADLIRQQRSWES